MEVHLKINKMGAHQMEHTDGNYTGPSLLALMWMLNLLTIMDKANITFVLGTIVTVMAGIHYFFQIRKTLREDKKSKQKTD